VNLNDGIFGCIAKFRRGFFAGGFTVIDPKVELEDEDGEWLHPCDPCDLLATDRFRRKL